MSFQDIMQRMLPVLGNGKYVPYVNKSGIVPDIKDENGNWDMKGHKSRIIEVDQDILELFAKLYDEDGTPYNQARLPVLHSKELTSVLRKFALQENKLSSLGNDFISTEMFHETNDQKTWFRV